MRQYFHIAVIILCSSYQYCTINEFLDHNLCQLQKKTASSASGSSTFTLDIAGKQLGCDKKMILQLKEDQPEVGEKKKIKETVKKHSQFIGYPLKLVCQKEEDEVVSDYKEKEKYNEVNDNNEDKQKIEDLAIIIQPRAKNKDR